MKYVKYKIADIWLLTHAVSFKTFLIECTLLVSLAHRQTHIVSTGIAFRTIGTGLTRNRN